MPVTYRLTKRRKLTLLSAVVALLIITAQHFGWINLAQNNLEKSQPGLYTVVGFSDGDTITVDMNGKKEKIDKKEKSCSCRTS